MSFEVGGAGHAYAPINDNISEDSDSDHEALAQPMVPEFQYHPLNDYESWIWLAGWTYYLWYPVELRIPIEHADDYNRYFHYCNPIARRSWLEKREPLHRKALLLERDKSKSWLRSVDFRSHLTVWYKAAESGIMTNEFSTLLLYPVPAFHDFLHFRLLQNRSALPSYDGWMRVSTPGTVSSVS
jgi:hypothetical protein